MIPRKPKDIIKELIEKEDIDQAFLEDAVSFYWKEIRIKLGELENPRIYVSGLGTFQIKDWKVDEHIRDFGTYVANLKNNKVASEEKRKSMRGYYKSLLNIKKQMDMDKLKKTKIKTNVKKNTGNLEQ